MKMSTRKYHGSVPFEIWTNRGSWFWGLISPRRAGGVVGAASTEPEAVHEACIAIEELANNPRMPLGAGPLFRRCLYG